MSDNNVASGYHTDDGTVLHIFLFSFLLECCI